MAWLEDLLIARWIATPTEEVEGTVTPEPLSLVDYLTDLKPVFDSSSAEDKIAFLSSLFEITELTAPVIDETISPLVV